MKTSLRIACFLGLVLVSAAPLARAQETEAERQACEPDVNRLCGQFIPDRDKIIVCLNQKIRQLSPACRTVMLYYAQERICASDTARLCADAADREATFACMRQKLRSASASCRNAFQVYARQRG